MISNWVSSWEVWLLWYVNIHVVQRVLFRVYIATLITEKLKFVWEIICLVSWILMATHGGCLPTHHLTDALLALIRWESLLIKAELIEIAILNSSSIKCCAVRIFVFIAHSHVMMLAFVELVLVKIWICLRVPVVIGPWRRVLKGFTMLTATIPGWRKTDAWALSLFIWRLLNHLHNSLKVLWLAVALLWWWGLVISKLISEGLPWHIISLITTWELAK